MAIVEGAGRSRGMGGTAVIELPVRRERGKSKRAEPAGDDGRRRWCVRRGVSGVAVDGLGWEGGGVSSSSHSQEHQ
ncbi:hypothetical protein IMZ48_35780 [Candidatus Bathyarchaeota archaeon]|nr:hypothetical protein [Candidatus Bathyarchaeota archaeon]